MQILSLYRYTRPDGGVTVSTVKPDAEYTELFRLVADEGMVLTDGNITTSCTDTADPSAWSEVEDTETPEESVVQEKAKAYDILVGAEQ